MQKKLTDTKTIRAEELAKDQREISISSFFEKNRHLLGFDNPVRALLTTVKELVDNAADASEEMHVLPEINVTIEQLAETRFRITVEDNGPGIVKEQIPKIFAKLLYGSKFFKLKMARGQQGIGVSASVLYAQLTTGKPTKIISKIDPKKPAHYYELHIDTQRNEPEIVKEEIIEWEKDHGTKVELELEAKYQKGKQGVFEYLKQTAIANPHILITYKGPEEEKVEFPRATNLLPIEPKQIKPHPLGVELGILIRMLKGTNARTLQSFLQTEFCRVGAIKAKEVCEEAKLQPSSRPKRIARQEAENLFQAIQKIKFVAPPTDCLSPISASLLEKGLKKEIDAEFYVSITRPPAVYRGFPFQIECCLAYGGNLDKEGPARLMRFANRVPLLYQQSAGAIAKSVGATNWKAYNLQQSGRNLPNGPLVIAVHIASVWVPFTSESKEAIAHYPEIIKEIRLAVQECGRQLGKYLRKNIRAKQEKERINLFERYIPELASSLAGLSGEKKTEIEDKLNKLLKKNMSSLLKENGKEE
ncbi:MAG: DNA topoisomerase VI subunit B [Nanoarchaeota archaeon]|nr:DNA topoisomerase VI subunit B [Nanoarchaeota archaeon]MBU1445114.1 DNA topoisomerase VI subunit B [Nanoarchaeota archaeon]MBU2406780.1 DNA topoisomerase VI subunit B [Nanoarchaeota archaeon]MBU2420100.1 DNA topoisomerase VI subunit B [Nanoarchaeota archaeon]MBU2475541.1 DNA topoisomerase VI subunit B [Nanoarchaeota archaeon]